MVSQRHLTWRIQNIPSNFSESKLISCFHSDDKKYIEIKSLVPDVNNYDGTGTMTATMLFAPPELREPRVEDEDLELDRDFLGFTPLNAVTANVSADVIAVTGLAGHAFGSWAHSDQKMWLRDYLPKDIQNRARILIYGYWSPLRGENVAKSIISDFGISFTQHLMDLRDHPSCRDRPLILIGHSLGALIIKQAITDLDPNIRSRLPVRTVLFFGAPHNGLEVAALETLVKGHPPQTLISELKHESPTLTGLSTRFRHIAKNLSIHTYYESRPTNTVVQGPDGTWERGGEPLWMVSRSSALLNIEQEETQMKVDGNHKEIARLRRGQGGAYPNVLRIIKDALQSASEQFAAAARAAEGKQSAASDQCNLGSASKIEDSEGEYDDDNLVCDKCFDEFPKTQTHYHCYICGDGNFNICQSCKKSGNSCPGGHDLLERQLGDPDASAGDDKVEDEDEDDTTLICDACDKIFPKDYIHFHCVICNDGYYDLCLSCRKSGRVCPGRHKMMKRQLPIDTPATANSSAVKLPSPMPPPKEKEPPKEETEYCDVSDCNCNLPKRTPPKNKKPPKKETEHYDFSGYNFPSYDFPSYEYSPPKSTKTPTSSKKGSSSSNNLTCQVCGSSFGTRNMLFNHLREKNHMVD